MKNKDKELFFLYLININSREIHDLKNESPNCHLGATKRKHRKFVRTLDEIYESDDYDYCRWCFGSEMSKR